MKESDNYAECAPAIYRRTFQFQIYLMHTSNTTVVSSSKRNKIKGINRNQSVGIGFIAVFSRMLLKNQKKIYENVCSILLYTLFMLFQTINNRIVYDFITIFVVLVSITILNAFGITCFRRFAHSNRKISKIDTIAIGISHSKIDFVVL